MIVKVLQRHVAAGVVDWFMIFTVGISIKFNYNFFKRTTEVNNIATNTVLSSEFSSVKIF